MVMQSNAINNTSKVAPQLNEDSEYDLCFVVEEVEFLSFKQGFVLHSPYLRELLEGI